MHRIFFILAIACSALARPEPPVNGNGYHHHHNGNGNGYHNGNGNGYSNGAPNPMYGVPNGDGEQEPPAPTYGSPAPTYGPPNGNGNGKPKPVYGAPKPNGNGPNNAYLPPNGNGYQYEKPEEATEPAKYEFEYKVEDEDAGLDFGHKESRDGDLAVGEYYVVLPDGRKQTVTYEADADGYRPVVKYEEGSAGNGGYVNGGYPQNGNGNGYH